MQTRDFIALVTGANRGIGRAYVEILLEHGVRRIYAAARTLSTLDAVVALDTHRIHPVRLDVTNVADARAVAAQAPDVNLVINNAAVLHLGGSADVSLDAVRANMETNFFGTLNVTRAFIPALERNRGAVVNMLTLVALVSMPVLSAYNASKAAALSLTQSLRADLAKRGVTVHGVFPGAVDTDMIRDFQMPKTSPGDVARAVLAGVAAGDEDIFPDPMAQQVYAAWRQDPKAVERQFASM